MLALTMRLGAAPAVRRCVLSLLLALYPVLGPTLLMTADVTEFDSNDGSRLVAPGKTGQGS